MEKLQNQIRVRKIQPIHGSSSFVLVIPKEFIADLNLSREDYVEMYPRRRFLGSKES